MQGAEPAERGPLEQSRAEISQHGQESPGAVWDGAVLVTRCWPWVLATAGCAAGGLLALRSF